MLIGWDFCTVAGHMNSLILTSRCQCTGRDRVFVRRHVFPGKLWNSSPWIAGVDWTFGKCQLLRVSSWRNGSSGMKRLRLSCPKVEGGLKSLQPLPPRGPPDGRLGPRKSKMIGPREYEENCVLLWSTKGLWWTCFLGPSSQVAAYWIWFAKQFQL